MNRNVFMALAVCLFIFSGIVFTSTSSAASKLIPVYTPATGGTGYILGAGIASLTKKYLQDVEMVVEPTTGALEMVRLIIERDRMKKEGFGIFGTVDAYYAFKGLKEYVGKPYPDLRAITFLWGADIYLVVPANSPIKSYADLKGKRVGMHGAGSSISLVAFSLLEAHGIKRQDFRPYFFVYKETMEGIKDGSLDAGFLGGSYPMASYTELSLTHKVRIVPVDEKVIKEMVRGSPYYYRAVVKAESYKGLEQDTPILGFAAGLFTHANVIVDLVYNIVKNLYEHRTEYYQVHASAKEMMPETALKGIPIPLHPGAEKYFKEIGVVKR
jgi:TRAP transporter TAXI family solute receptor